MIRRPPCDVLQGEHPTSQGPRGGTDCERFSYSEQRFISVGLLAGVPVSVVHTESEHEIRIILFRKATRSETSIFFNAIQD